MIRLLTKDFHINHDNNILKTAIKNNSVFVVMNIVRFICTYEQACNLELKDMFHFSLQSENRNEQISMVLLDKVTSLYPKESIPLNDLLISSLKRSFVNVSRKLLLNGADSNFKDNTGHSILYYVLETGNSELLQLLVDHYNININEIFNDENIIFYAINKHNSKISSILIGEGTDIFCKNKNGEYLIEVYIKKGWFLHSPAGETIDLRFLFGETKTVLAKELLVETAPWDMQSEMTLYSVEDIEEKVIEEKIPEVEDQSQYVILAVIVLVGIGAVIFYLKGYKPKH